MTSKKKSPKATSANPEGQAVLDALRSNQSLLRELAARYEVPTRPEGPARPQSTPPATFTACSDRRCPPWHRSSCACCCWIARAVC